MKREFRLNRSDRKFRQKCTFCKAKVNEVDYKDVTNLSKFLDRWNKIDNRERTGACAKHQRWLTLAIKRARFLGLLPYTVK